MTESHKVASNVNPFFCLSQALATALGAAYWIAAIGGAIAAGLIIAAAGIAIVVSVGCGALHSLLILAPSPYILDPRPSARSTCCMNPLKGSQYVSRKRLLGQAVRLLSEPWTLLHEASVIAAHQILWLR